MNLQSTRDLLYGLEADIARKINVEATKPDAKRALECAHLRCQEIAEWLTTAEKRENVR